MKQQFALTPQQKSFAGDVKNFTNPWQINT